MNDNSNQKNKFFKKYLKYKKKYLDLKIFKFGGNNMNQTDLINNMNQTSLQKAQELNYQTNEDLHLIIGTSNDNRFDELKGFTVNSGNETGEQYHQNKTILPLNYDITKIDFFLNDISQFKFHKIIFDYNVIDVLLTGIGTLMEPISTFQLQVLISKLLNLLTINGQLYLPINIKKQPMKPILDDHPYFEEYIKPNIKFDHTNRTFIDLHTEEPMGEFFIKKYRYSKDGYNYKDITPYDSYLNSSKRSIRSILNIKRKHDNQLNYNLQFFINSLVYTEENYPGTNDLQFIPYPIQSRISEFKFSGSICEFAVFTKIN